jgi:probable rRNA maturation factor
MIEVEIFDRTATRGALASRALRPVEIRSLCAAVASAVGIDSGHLAVEFVDERRIAQLNAAHRGKAEPTDVLSFPLDEVAPVGGAQRELGDVVICLRHVSDPHEALVHGVLHLLGMDHETDDGRMLALQARLLAEHLAEHP